ncbi:MAG: hypothetical protein FJ086_05660 [Deltaproteobacteria bacterium]|nr:hypothetical protein [Deltaproteobacteria bacterium]
MPCRLAPATLAAVLLLSLPAAAEDAPEADTASALVGKYLKAVQAKKWVHAQKLVHPGTVKAIAERKKRNATHPMDPKAFEKTEYYLKAFRVGAVKASAAGTFVVEVSEDNFQVEEKGLAEGDAATYLVGKQDGKWYVVDKKRNETFTADSIKYGYKGFFDRVEKAPDAASPAGQP